MINYLSPNEQPTILIVDDEPSNVQLLARCLRGEYHIKVADSGFKALDIVYKGSNVDLILLDIMMPVMDGFQVCKRLKKNPDSARIPVIFISAANDDHSQLEGLGLGAVDYITKPIKPDLVNARIKNQIARKLDEDRIRRDFEDKMSYSTYYDKLTGLPNKLLLLDYLRQAISEAQDQNTTTAVCHIELDGIETIQYESGAEAVDELIVMVAKRISQLQSRNATVARVGFEEFALVVPGVLEAESVTKMLNRLLVKMEQPILIQQKPCRILMNIGVCFYPHASGNPKTLLRKAEQAMQLAKQTATNSFHVYDHELEISERLRKELLQEIAQGLDDDEFVLYYQPKINMATGDVLGAEALIRWNHPLRGFLLPNEFISVVENSELEIAMGEWVIDAALKQLVEWGREGLDIEISVNISALHLQSGTFVEWLQQKLECYSEVLPNRLQIELLETAAVGDMDKVSDIIKACTDLGVSFSLDDFGTGYSSLGYLRELPVKTLKIDQSFVRTMLEDENNQAIVRGIIGIAESLNLQVVAEGVETLEHVNVLLKMNCLIGQGYGIAKPMSARGFIIWFFSDSRFCF